MTHRKVLRGVQNTDFLRANSLIHTFRRRREDIRLGKPKDKATGVSCKKSAKLLVCAVQGPHRGGDYTPE